MQLSNRRTVKLLLDDVTIDVIHKRISVTVLSYMYVVHVYCIKLTSTCTVRCSSLPQGAIVVVQRDSAESSGNYVPMSITSSLHVGLFGLWFTHSSAIELIGGAILFSGRLLKRILQFSSFLTKLT